MKRSETIKQRLIEAGRAERAACDKQLGSKRARRAAAAAERQRIEALKPATRFSELVERDGYSIR